MHDKLLHWEPLISALALYILEINTLWRNFNIFHKRNFISNLISWIFPQIKNADKPPEVRTRQNQKYFSIFDIFIFFILSGNSVGSESLSNFRECHKIRRKETSECSMLYSKVKYLNTVWFVVVIIKLKHCRYIITWLLRHFRSDFTFWHYSLGNIWSDPSGHFTLGLSPFECQFCEWNPL